MTTTKLLRALFVILCCSGGCWGADDDGSSDAGPGMDAGSGVAVPTDFVFYNRGTDPVVLGGNCGETWPSLTQDGETLGIDTSCACSCADFHSPAGCPGCPDICLNTTELVVPGVPHTYNWDGLALNFARPECYSLQAPAHGSLITAWACHDLAASDNPPCVSTEFEYGVDEEVTLTATPGPQPGERHAIVIENQTGVSIEIVVDHCGSEAWFQVAEEDPRISTSVFCPCSCNDAFQPDVCPVCGACADDVVVTLAQGESHDFDWDGRFWYQYDSGCARNYAMPASYGPLVKVCYTKLGDDAATCTTPTPLVTGPGVNTFLVTE